MAFSDEALTIQPIGAYFSGRGKRHGLCFDPMREKPREGPCVFRVGSI